MILRSPISSEADVAALSEDERSLLSQWIADAVSCSAPPRMAQVRRRIALLAMTAVAVFLVPWVAWLSSSLPSRHASQQWRLAWTGFDIALILAFAATAWTGWRNRQLVITALVVVGTLLLCDAWFDVTLSWGTGDQAASIATAALAEVPFAVLALLIAHRLLREVTHYVWHLEGRPDPVVPLHRLPLIAIPDAHDRSSH